MKTSTATLFSKKLACPSSNLLLSFSAQSLAPEINVLVKHHLAGCDFCYCEIPLLAFHTVPAKGEGRAPDLPMNLRVLAESILGRGRSGKVLDENAASENCSRLLTGELVETTVESASAHVPSHGLQE